jgi:hypothetical protein
MSCKQGLIKKNDPNIHIDTLKKRQEYSPMNIRKDNQNK